MKFAIAALLGYVSAEQLFGIKQVTDENLGDTDCYGGDCPYDDAVCCTDQLHCCPNGTTCDLAAGTCDSAENSKIPYSLLKRDPAPETLGDTDCYGGDCPYDDAVCCTDQLHCCPNGTTCDLAAGTCDSAENSKIPYILLKRDPVPETLGDTDCYGGDCPYDDAVCCTDQLHCCPNGTTCDLAAGTCDSAENSKIPYILLQRDPAPETLGDTDCYGGDCPYDDAVCCTDQLHCCPNGTTCDLAAGTCDSAENSKIPYILLQRDPAPETLGDTDCYGGDCPYDDAVCCTDQLHCCPNGTTCDLAAGTCDSAANQKIPFTLV